jgi:hypothetical protein
MTDSTAISRLAGSGAETLLEPTWSAPLWLPLLLALLAALLAVGLYLSERAALNRRQRLVLAGLRWLSCVTVLVMLYGWTISRYRTDLPDLVLAIDVSTSMALEDQYPPERRARLRQRLQSLNTPDEEPTRFNLLQALLTEERGAFVQQLQKRYHVRCFQLGNAARALEKNDPETIGSLRPEEENSRLGIGLRQIAAAQRGRPTAAIVLFSDGVTTEGPSLVEVSRELRQKGIPLFLVGLGTEQPQRDLRLADLLVEEAAFVNDLVPFDARVVAAGYEGEATVRLTNADTGETLAETRVNFPPDEPVQPVRLTWRPTEQGNYDVRLEVVAVEGESNQENNLLRRKIRVTDVRLKVLLVQAGPSFEFRFLKALFERELNRDADATKEERGFHSILQEADQEYVATDQSALRLFPATREELFAYDVLIFGDVNPEFLSRTALENIVDFVNVRGGGLIFCAGPRFTPWAYRDSPLAALFPFPPDTAFLPDSAAQSAPFRPRITAVGAAAPGLQLADSSAENLLVWQERLNPLLWYFAISELRPGVRVLAEHPTQTGSLGQPLPIIAQQYVGAGRVIFHATDETHRWRFRGGEEYFARYWIQTVRSLAHQKLEAGQGVELTTDKSEYRRGESVELRVRFLDETLAPPQDDGTEVILERPGLPRRAITLQRSSGRGIFEATVPSLPDGDYRAWLAAPALPGAPAERRFAIAASPSELAKLEADLAGMREAAKNSGGKFYTWEQASRLPADLPQGRQVRIEALPPEPIWNSPLVAALFVALLGSEWMLRKRWGLP